MADCCALIQQGTCTTEYGNSGVARSIIMHAGGATNRELSPAPCVPTSWAGRRRSGTPRLGAANDGRSLLPDHHRALGRSGGAAAWPLEPHADKERKPEPKADALAC